MRSPHCRGNGNVYIGKAKAPAVGRRSLGKPDAVSIACRTSTRMRRSEPDPPASRGIGNPAGALCDGISDAPTARTLSGG
jgi:hypothetical protein